MSLFQDFQIDSLHFLNKSLDNAPRNFEGNTFYHLRQQFRPNILDLLEKQGKWTIEKALNIYRRFTY